ncbi:bro [Trichoplusia ni granulovirus LBIV-12]|jgi:prophage antirepressor-like protein|uniref:Bro n=2 Tax=Betabaculovirus TaxID=558017 RepID=A0A1D8QLB0_GVTN|nr:BRO [Pseudalatia unipuncta granulovirus]YP_009506178.1 bro [Trichoplusia ni granulovirus LBIV-12]ACH69468.1 BRO [Pseudalatia unipuncta granulovirus]AOW41446.1 bro [Trichoplusia ni granulovirus LBIV-12]
MLSRRAALFITASPFIYSTYEPVALIKAHPGQCYKTIDVKMSLRKQVILFQNEPIEVVFSDKTGPDGLVYYFLDIAPFARLLNLDNPLSKIDSQHVIVVEEPAVASETNNWVVRNGRSTTLVSEAGLYQLMFTGKPVTVRQGMVRNWLFDVVLPTIKQYTDTNHHYQAYSHNNSQQYEHINLNQLNLNGVNVPSCVSNDILRAFKQIIEAFERQLKQKDLHFERICRTNDEQLLRKDEMLLFRERELEAKTNQLASKEKQLKNALSLIDFKENQLSEVIALTQKKDLQLEQQFNMISGLMGKHIKKIEISDSDDETQLPQNHDTVLMIVRENSTTFKGIAAKRRYVDQQKQKLRYHESMIVVHSKRPDPKRDWSAAMDIVAELGVKDRCQIYPNLKRVRFEQVKDADLFEKGLKKMFNVTDAV